MTRTQWEIFRLVKRKLSLEDKYFRIRGQLEGIEMQLNTLREYEDYKIKQQDIKKNEQRRNEKPIIYNR